MKLSLLRYLLVIDALVLFLLGALLILAPSQVERAFHFRDLPPAISYIIGLWGCVFATLALGYLVAATDPPRHVVWVQVGIARGVLECILAVVYLARGVVTFQQAGFGLVLAALISTAYILCYPRQPKSGAPMFSSPANPL